ncbi:MAG: formimidoylglutamase [Cytophagaceae bacterium]|nr:formimidoylglutamase [Cytophagaceae bacterium]
MELSIFFDPVSTRLPNTEDFSLFGNNIRSFYEEFPALDQLHIAIIGIAEDRGSMLNEGCAKGPEEVRKKLYSLKKNHGNLKIADLGNLRPGESVEDTYLRIKEVCATLMQLQIIPVLIGGSHDLDYGQFMAYEGNGNFINVLCVDAAIDMSGVREDQSKHHTHRMLLHQPNYLFNYSHLAYQSFLTDQEVVAVLEKLHFESYRIGWLRDHMNEAEPVIRDADMMSFDISSIRQTDAPGNKCGNAFGLSGEEACQLAWYAGLSNKLSSLGIYEFNPEEDWKDQTASVVAAMIWYFVEGFYARKEERNFDSPNYTHYLVSFEHDPEKMTFYKHELTEKWWMEVPIPENKERYLRNSIIPCSYEDFLTANNGEIPDRWIRTRAKLS